MECLCNLSTDTFNAAYCLHIELLRRELDGGVTRMDTGKLNMLGDGIGQNLTILCHGIHLNLLGILNELRHHDRMIL